MNFSEPDLRSMAYFVDGASSLSNQDLRVLLRLKLSKGGGVGDVGFSEV